MWRLGPLSALMVMSFRPAMPEVAGCGWYGPHAVDVDGQSDVNNDLAQPNELPWMVMVLDTRMVQDKNKRDRNVNLSNGVLINPRVALVSRNSIAGTASEDLVVRAGDWDLSAYCKIYVQERNVSKIILPTYGKTGNPQRRVAILILSSPFVLGENVGVMCLPRNNDEYDRLRCIISGWSDNVFDPQQGNRLERISAAVISNDECHDVYVDYSNRYRVLISLYRDYICAGSKKKSSKCLRDRGSPLICPLLDDPSRYVLVGLDISRFQPKLNEMLPHQFADVAAARDSIDHEMSINGLNASVYTYIKHEDEDLISF